MSRKIMQLHETFRENLVNQTQSGKVIITKYNDKEVALLIKGNRLLSLYALDNASKVGAIYVGKIKNIVNNLNACFVEIINNELCYLPFSEATSPIILNRKYDGRLFQGDELIVQVQKDALKTKQAALTCNISYQTDYFVFTIGNNSIGVSGKLSKKLKSDIKDSLYNYLATMESAPTCNEFPLYSCIVRTQAGRLFESDKDSFIKEFISAKEEFMRLISSATHKTCFSCIKSPKKPYEAILDCFGATEYQEVLTDLNEAYTSLQDNVPNIRLYQDENFPLTKLYSLETKIQDAFNKNVWLKCGGYLVIEQTECLTTIDVNSGKMISGNNNAEVIIKINEEAAIEAAIQIRLRNLSGIIIIDFINMVNKDDEAYLLNLMKELTHNDKVTTSVIDITPLGLMEVTRKKVHKSLKEQFQH